MAITQEHFALFERLATEVPAIARLRDQHLRDYEELLPHLLMADVARYVASYFADATGAQVPPPSREELGRTLALIDAAMGSEPEPVRELISVSFLENLEHEPYTAALVMLLGLNLRRELERRASS